MPSPDLEVPGHGAGSLRVKVLITPVIYPASVAALASPCCLKRSPLLLHHDQYPAMLFFFFFLKLPATPFA